MKSLKKQNKTSKKKNPSLFQWFFVALMHLSASLYLPAHRDRMLHFSSLWSKEKKLLQQLLKQFSVLSSITFLLCSFILISLHTLKKNSLHPSSRSNNYLVSWNCSACTQLPWWGFPVPWFGRLTIQIYIVEGHPGLQNCVTHCLLSISSRIWIHFLKSA